MRNRLGRFAPSCASLMRASKLYCDDVVRLLCLCIGLFFITGCGSQSAPEPPTSNTKATTPRELTVAAASDLKFALEEMITAFETGHPEIKVRPTFGSSGNFFTQLSNKAPFDLFLSADISYPQKLVELDLAVKDSLFSYAIGQIVIWVPKSSQLDVESLGLKVLSDPSIKKFAIANPKHAPYGRAAVSALKELGVYDEIADRLVLGENVAQAAQFIDSGAADIGIIALSLAKSPSQRERGRYWLIPETAYPPLEQGGVTMKWAREKTIAAEFQKFLVSDRGPSILESHGFKLPERNHDHGAK